jgi:DNA gyrase inhibitor GyrI
MGAASTTPSRVAYRDFPVFTSHLVALDSAHKTWGTSCDDPAQVPRRKMRLKACIVQPQSRDMAAGGVYLIAQVLDML